LRKCNSAAAYWVDPLPQMDRVLIFDIWGDYAHFKRIETTTSPLTYPIPTGTSLLGLISAIIGLERDSYNELFSPETARFAIRILNPIRKIRINQNLINTKVSFSLRGVTNPRTRIPFEFLKQPKYRIYFWTSHKKLYKKLKGFLENHLCFYTPYLGISELIAGFEYVAESQIEDPKKAEEKTEIHTLIRKDMAKLIVEEKKRYGFERIPLYMNKNRVVQEYADVFFEVNGQTLNVVDSEYYEIGYDHVFFV